MGLGFSRLDGGGNQVTDVAAQLAGIVGDKNILIGDAISEDYAHDEALSATPEKPTYVAKPATAEEVAGLLRIASEHRVPVTARGSGSGLSGAARPVEGGLLISFERMDAVLEVDADNHVAVVQPGVTLAELDAKTAENNHIDRLHEDAESLSELLGELGAVDAHVLEGASARRLIQAREHAFWAAEGCGVD